MIQNYTNFEYCEEKIHRHFETYNFIQSQAIYDNQKNSKKSLHILEGVRSDVQVGDIEQVIV